MGEKHPAAPKRKERTTMSKKYANPEVTLDAIKKTKDFSEWSNEKLVEVKMFLNNKYNANISFSGNKGRDHAVQELMKFKRSKTKKKSKK